MNKIIILILLVTPLILEAQTPQRDCELECPQGFSYASDPELNESNRQNCISRCQQGNNLQQHLEKQDQQMTEQKELMETQLEEQRDLHEELMQEETSPEQQEEDPSNS